LLSFDTKHPESQSFKMKQNQQHLKKIYLPGEETLAETKLSTSKSIYLSSIALQNKTY